MAGLQAGLSQTDWFGLGTGIVGTGYAAAAYNQAAYLSSVAMRQSQLYQKKNYDLSWVSVARDDIRDMMNISVTRISNYMMVATLILGVSSDALLGTNFPDTCPDFIQTAFWVSMALSILFFTESIMFAVKGQNSAFTNTVRLLTWELRPENPAPYDHDYMQQMNHFENHGLQELLRVPGLATHFGDSPDQARRGKDDGATSKSAASDASPGEGFWSRIRGGGKRPASGAGSSQDASCSRPFWRAAGGDGNQHTPSQLEHIEPSTNMLLYLARYSHFMQLWQPYETSSKYCIGLGLISLVHGAAYFCLGHFSQSGLYMANCIVVITVAIFVFVTAIVYQQNFHSGRRISRWTVYLLISVGPMLGILGGITTSSSVRSWAGTLVFLSHTIRYLVAWLISLFEYKKPWEITRKFTAGPRGQQFPEEWLQAFNETDDEDMWRDPSRGDRRYMGGALPGQSLDSEEEAGLSGIHQPDGLYGVLKPSAAERRKVVKTSNRVSSIVRSSMLFAALVWFVTTWASLFTNFESWGLWLASWTFDKGDVIDGTPIEIVAPIPSAHISSLACRRGIMFAANSFQVFQVDVSTGELSPYSCALKDEVSDLAITCDTRSCRPLVLQGDSDILDCASGEVAPLLKGMTAQRIVLADAAPAGKLRTLSNGTQAEYIWNPSVKGWDPQWFVHGVDSDDIDLDWLGSRLFLVSLHKQTKGFSYRNGISVRSPSDSSLVGEWRFRDNTYTTVAGCAMDAQTAYVVQKGSSVRLLRVALPS